MSEIRTVTTLRSKRDEIIDSIRFYERQLKQARTDLAHVTPAIRIFEASGNSKDMATCAMSQMGQYAHFAIFSACPVCHLSRPKKRPQNFRARKESSVMSALAPISAKLQMQRSDETCQVL